MPAPILEALQAVGVDVAALDGPFPYYVNPPSTQISLSAARRVQIGTPLTSCLMVSRGNPAMLQYAVACYQQQTYPRRELIVVTDRDRAAGVEMFLGDRRISNATVVGVDPALTLGDRRNVSVAHAKGDIVMIWDDDDLSDPQRIFAAVGVLQQTNADAAFLTRWLLWWPQRNIAAVSGRRVWEGSMAIWRSRAPVYPAMTRGEDSAAVDFVKLNCSIALMDAPFHYIYVVTGRNTFDAAHFETLLGEADCVFEGADFRELTALLSRRVPILDYEARLRATF
jgi:glycosyltransferase involved in cell wall biosynthesis